MAAGKQLSTHVKFSRQDITRALAEVAYWNGNARQAQRQLEQQGFDVSRQTLDNWKKQHAEIYESCLSHVDAQVIDRTDEAQRENLALIIEGTQQIREELPSMPARDVTTVVRNAGVVFGITTEKAQLLKGQPTQRTEIVDPAAILKELNELARQANATADVDSTAEEDD